MRDLSIEEIEQIAVSFKDDLMREMKRAARRHDPDSPYESYAAVKAEEAIDQFIYSLRLRAGSQLHTLLRPPRARPIHIPKILKAK